MSRAATGCSARAWRSREAIRARVREDLKLSCSVGIARCKLLAKLASKAAKPIASPGGPLPGPGIVVVDPEAGAGVPASPAGLGPVGRGATDGRAPCPLRDRDDRRPRRRSTRRTSPASSAARAGAQLHELAWARDDRPVVMGQAVKSVGHEETFAVDMHDPEQLRLEAARMADAVSSRLSALRPRRPDGDGEAPLRRLHHDHAVALAAPPGRLLGRARQDRRRAAVRRDVHPGVRLLGRQRLVARGES